jgi:hypothetical protein
MTGHVIINSIKNYITVLVSFNDNLCRAVTRLSIDRIGKYLNYPLMKGKIFILSRNAEIIKYEAQQLDIGILFRLSTWLHLVIIAAHYM